MTIARSHRFLPNGGRIVLGLFTGLVLLFLVVPLLILLPISFSSGMYTTFPPPGFSIQWYEKYFADPAWIDATLRSVQIGGATAVLSLLIGIPLSFGLARSPFAGRWLVENAISAPLIIPTIIFSIAIYGLFSQLRLIGEWYGVAIAHTVLALPFVSVVLVAGLRDFDTNLELAARGLGAGRLQALRHVTMPLVSSSLLQAAFLAFITSFDELVVSMFLAGANVTLPKKMFDDILNQIEPTVAAVAVLQIAMVCLLLLLSEWFVRHRQRLLRRQ